MNSVIDLRRTLGMWTLLALIGCSSALSAAEPTIPKTLDGLEFRSVKKFEVSVLPSGPVMEHRTLKFKEKEFTYTPADYVDTGKFTWDAKRGEVVAEAMSGKKYKGKYDPKTKILKWEGVDYKAVESEKKKKESDSSTRSGPKA